MGSLFETYNPEGALGGMFAPAYIRGFAPSEEALAQYYQQGAGHRLGPNELEQTRMPSLWKPVEYSKGDGRYGGPLPLTQNYIDPAGTIDPNALRAASQGGIAYDMGARRDAIAARLAANAAAQATAAPAIPVKKKRGDEDDGWRPDDPLVGRYNY
jgi:hypothetical protein